MLGNGEERRSNNLEPVGSLASRGSESRSSGLEAEMIAASRLHPSGTLYQSQKILSDASSVESQDSHLDEACPTCGRPCKSTAVLPCGHHVCLSCVAKTYSVQDPNAQSRNELSCPVCRSVSSIGAGLRSLLLGPSFLSEVDQKKLQQKQMEVRCTETPAVSFAAPLARAVIFCARCRKGISSTKAGGGGEGAVYCCTCFEFYCRPCSDQLHRRDFCNAFSRHRIKFLKVDENGVNKVVGSADMVEKEELDERSVSQSCRARTPPLAGGGGTASELSAAGLSCPESWQLRNPHAILEDYRCLNHPNEPVQFRCLTCQSMAICAQCCVVVDVHKGHSLLPLDRAFLDIRYSIIHDQRAEREAEKMRLRTLLHRAQRVGTDLENTMTSAATVLQKGVEDLTKELEVEIGKCAKNAEATTQSLMQLCFSRASDSDLEKMEEFMRLAANHTAHSRDEELCDWFSRTPFLDASRFQLLAEGLAARLARARLVLQHLREKTSLKCKDAVTTKNTIRKEVAELSSTLSTAETPRQAICKALQTTDPPDPSLFEAADVNLANSEPTADLFIRPTNAKATFLTSVDREDGESVEETARGDSQASELTSAQSTSLAMASTASLASTISSSALSSTTSLPTVTDSDEQQSSEVSSEEQQTSEVSSDEQQSSEVSSSSSRSSFDSESESSSSSMSSFSTSSYTSSSRSS